MFIPTVYHVFSNIFSAKDLIYLLLSHKQKIIPLTNYLIFDKFSSLDNKNLRIYCLSYCFYVSRHWDIGWRTTSIPTTFPMVVKLLIDYFLIDSFFYARTSTRELTIARACTLAYFPADSISFPTMWIVCLANCLLASSILLFRIDNRS